VTGEEKADWWAKSSGIELLARYELVDEYRRTSDGKSFHLINFFQLLELFKVESEIIDQAKIAQKEEEEYKEQESSESQDILDEHPQRHNFSSFIRAAESAIRNWVKEQLDPYVDSINTENRYVDFTVHGSGAVIGFEVKGIRHVEHIARRIREVFTLGEQFLADLSPGFSAFRVVFVTEDLDTAIKAMEYAKKISFSNSRYGVIIGHLDNEFNFKEIYRTYNDSYDCSLLFPF